MTDTHSQIFFGQNTGIILTSLSKSEPYIFIRCIKKKPNGLWEKPSTGEGKVIKCTMEEMVMMLEVLNRKLLNWTNFHEYKDIKTPISFSWEDEKAKILWISIANYSKMLNFAQAKILMLLLTHLLKEKIKYATISNRDNLNNKIGKNDYFNKFNSKIKNHKDRIFDFRENCEQKIVNEIFDNSIEQDNNSLSKLSTKEELLNEITNIDGSIRKETEKALLIDFNSGKEIWIPKSTIHCQYTPRKNLTQKFLIDNWILKRNKIIS